MVISSAKSPKLPHIYTLLQSILDHGPFILLEFSNEDILYILHSLQIPPLSSIDRQFSPEVDLFAESWNLLISFWSSFIKEKNKRENLQAFLRDLVLLIPYLNIEALSFLQKKEEGLISIQPLKQFQVKLSGVKGIPAKRKPISDLKEKLPNLPLVTRSFSQLLPHMLALFSYIFIETPQDVTKSIASLSSPKWPSEPQMKVEESTHTLSEQVESIFEEVKSITTSKVQTAAISTDIAMEEKPPPSGQNLDHILLNLKTTVHNLAPESKQEFLACLELLNSVLLGVKSPVSVLVESTPKELVSLILSLIGLLEDVLGPTYSEISTSLINWIISFSNLLQDEGNLSFAEWDDRAYALINEGQSFSEEIRVLLNDPWLLGWKKRFIDHFLITKASLSRRIPPMPEAVDFTLSSDVYKIVSQIRSWVTWLFFSIPSYIGTIAWEFPIILLPHWFKNTFTGPFPRLEFKVKRMEGWFDEIGSLSGNWALSLQALSRIYPKEDPFSDVTSLEPWLPGLKKVQLPSFKAEPTSRWFIQLATDYLSIRDVRYFYKYRTRWLTLGIKKKAFCDSGRVDMTIGKEKLKGKKALKDKGMVIKLEVGVPGVLGAPMVSRPAPFSMLSLIGIHVSINSLSLHFKSERHSALYPFLLPFVTSIVRRNMETFIETQTIRMING